MKVWKMVCMMVVATVSLSAQNEGVITYKETVSLDVPEEVKAQFSEALKGLSDTYTIQTSLTFKKDEMLYREDEQGSLANEDGYDDEWADVQIYGEESSSIYYTHAADKYYIEKTDLMGKEFYIKDTIEALKWKLTPEKVKYLGFVCQKATSNRGGKDIIAWFTTEIPHRVGPKDFMGLPGAILMVKEGKEYEAKAQKVDLTALKSFDKPTPKKTVSAAEFAKISDEKMKEIEEMYGGSGTIIQIKK